MGRLLRFQVTLRCGVLGAASRHRLGLCRKKAERPRCRCRPTDLWSFGLLRPRSVSAGPRGLIRLRSLCNLPSFRRNGSMYERWLILAVLTFARTVMGFQFQSVAAISPYLIDQFQISYAALGTLIGLYLFPGTAVAVPGGVLAQRFGDKRITCSGLVAMACGAVMMATVENFVLLFAGRIVSGTGAVLLNVIVTK